jgi:hypothetical protein
MMASNEEICNRETKKKFIPVCFKKELNRFTEQFKINNKNQKIRSEQFSTNLNGKDTYTILKNLDMSLKKCQEIEYSKQRLKLNEAVKLFKISNNCDIYTLKAKDKLFNLFKYDVNFKVIRFFSFSNINNCYFFLYQILKENDDKFKYCKGGIVIPTNEKKIFVYMKRSKKMSSKNLKYYFNMMTENFKIILDVMGRFLSKEDIERLSTVESLETEAESILKKGEIDNKNPVNQSNNNASEELNNGSSDNMNYENQIMTEESVDWGDLDLNLIEDESNKFIVPIRRNSNEININLKYDLNEIQEPKFFIDEDDEDYRRVRKLNTKDLVDLDLFNAYSQVKLELHEDIEKYNIQENEIIRYIYGWRGDVVNVKKSLVDLQIWRQEYAPANLTMADFAYVNYDLHNLIHVACQDIYGRPVILFKARNLRPKSIEIHIFIKYLIFNIEQAVKIMPSNVDKIAIALDIKDTTLSNISVEHIKSIKDQTSKYYVERLSSIIVINKGFFFGMIWSLLSSFLDERVTKKLIVVNNSNMPWLKKILGHCFDKIFS